MTKTTVIFKTVLEQLATMALQDIPMKGDTLTLLVEGKNLDCLVLSVHRDLSDPINPVVTVKVSRL